MATQTKVKLTAKMVEALVKHVEQNGDGKVVHRGLRNALMDRGYLQEAGPCCGHHFGVISEITPAGREALRQYRQQVKE